MACEVMDQFQAELSLAEKPVHDLSAAAQFGDDHLPVHGLGRQGALVTDEVGDVLKRHPVGAEERNERVPELPRHPVGTQASCLRDLPELAQHVVTIEWLPIEDVKTRP